MTMTSPSVPRARILIVDDETTARSAITRALNLMDYLADSAASGRQALEKLATQPYDLMLLDLHMPGIDGVEVMKQVQKNYPDLLVIVLTAYGTLESAITAIQIGAADYILKPSSIRDIEAAIANALEQHHERLRHKQVIDTITDAVNMLRCGDELQDPSTLHAQRERFLRCGPVTLDQDKHLVVVAGDDETCSLKAELTANETALLACLLQRPETVISCRELARVALDYDLSEPEAQEIIRPHISRLRKKVETDSAHPRLLRTIRGKGYLFHLA